MARSSVRSWNYEKLLNVLNGSPQIAIRRNRYMRIYLEKSIAKWGIAVLTS